MTCYALFTEVKSQIGHEAIASKLGLNKNTIDRWIEQAHVPTHYENDLKRLVGEKTQAEDQFFTKPNIAEHCMKAFARCAENLGIDLKKYHFIEPSAGAGAFLNLLPESRRTGLDIDPRGEGILARDFLLWTPERNEHNERTKYIVIGNPPFGLRGHLALQFINHAATFADMVAFIVPQLFASDGKGVPAKRVNDQLKLAHSEALPHDAFVRPDGSPIAITTLFQVWSRMHHERIKMPVKKTCDSFIKIYSLSDGGTPSSTRNKHMLDKCDLYLPSTCFKGMRCYDAFETLPNRRGMGVVVMKKKPEIMKLLQKHDWMKTAFRSTNGALNLRFSLIKNVVIEGGLFD